MMQFSIEIGWWIAFLVMSLFFSGMEVAFVASDKLRYAVNKKEKGVYNFMLNTIYSHPRQFLSTLVVANHIVLAFFVYFTMVIVHDRVFDQVLNGWLLPLTIVFMTLVILLTDEFIPRVLFKKNPSWWVRVFALPGFVFYVLLYPMARAFIALSKGVRSLFGIRSTRSDEQTYGRTDWDAYVKKSIDNMSKDSVVYSKVNIFRNAHNFTGTTLIDCMVPRPEIVAVSLDTDFETLKVYFFESGISLFRVSGKDIFDIVGYIHMW